MFLDNPSGLQYKNSGLKTHFLIKHVKVTRVSKVNSFFQFCPTIKRDK